MHVSFFNNLLILYIDGFEFGSSSCLKIIKKSVCLKLAKFVRTILSDAVLERRHVVEINDVEKSFVTHNLTNGTTRSLGGGNTRGGTG